MKNTSMSQAFELAFRAGKKAMSGFAREVVDPTAALEEIPALLSTWPKSCQGAAIHGYSFGLTYNKNQKKECPYSPAQIHECTFWWRGFESGRRDQE